MAHMCAILGTAWWFKSTELEGAIFRERQRSTSGIQERVSSPWPRRRGVLQIQKARQSSEALCESSHWQKLTKQLCPLHSHDGGIKKWIKRYPKLSLSLSLFGAWVVGQDKSLNTLAHLADMWNCSFAKTTKEQNTMTIMVFHLSNTFEPHAGF